MTRCDHPPQFRGPRVGDIEGCHKCGEAFVAVPATNGTWLKISCPGDAGTSHYFMAFVKSGEQVPTFCNDCMGGVEAPAPAATPASERCAHRFKKKMVGREIGDVCGISREDHDDCAHPFVATPAASEAPADDLVKRLVQAMPFATRGSATLDADVYNKYRILFREAADEIKRLRAANARVKVLEPGMGTHYRCVDVFDVDAALEGDNA